MKIQFALVMSTLALVSGLGCGGQANGGTGSVGAGSGGAGTNSGSTSSGSAGSAPTASCEPTAADTGSVQTASASVPLNHRASPCCSSRRGPGPGPEPYPPGMAATDPSVACTLDSQCTKGSNGRCFPFEGQVGPGGCSYDECSTDSDCPANTPCVCRSGPTDNAANVCAPGGNCAVDSDCGAGGYCSPSVADCYAQNPYFCHTALDTCVNDADCPPVDGSVPNFASAVCAYDSQAQHWACKGLVCYPP
jgi:hypothetical protein